MNWKNIILVGILGGLLIYTFGIKITLRVETKKSSAEVYIGQIVSEVK